MPPETAPALVAGLGNPGPRYRDTRHNTGRRFLGLIGKHYQAAFRKKTGVGELARIQVRDASPWLFKPATFMNESGRAIQAAMHALHLHPERLLVAYDDIDLPPGTVRLKRSGGHGGHNGMRNILLCIGDDFPRLRFGIGRPPHKEEVIDYVLRRPDQDQAELIDQALQTALQAFPLIAAGHLEEAMQQLHSHPPPLPPPEQPDPTEADPDSDSTPDPF